METKNKNPEQNIYSLGESIKMLSKSTIKKEQRDLLGGYFFWGLSLFGAILIVYGTLLESENIITIGLIFTAIFILIGFLVSTFTNLHIDAVNQVRSERLWKLLEELSYLNKTWERTLKYKQEFVYFLEKDVNNTELNLEAIEKIRILIIDQSDTIGEIKSQINNINTSSFKNGYK